MVVGLKKIKGERTKIGEYDAIVIDEDILKNAKILVIEGWWLPELTKEERDALRKFVEKLKNSARLL